MNGLNPCSPARFIACADKSSIRALALATCSVVGVVETGVDGLAGTIGVGIVVLVKVPIYFEMGKVREVSISRFVVETTYELRQILIDAAEVTLERFSTRGVHNRFTRFILLNSLFAVTDGPHFKSSVGDTNREAR